MHSQLEHLARTFLRPVVRRAKRGGHRNAMLRHEFGEEPGIESSGHVVPGGNRTERTRVVDETGLANDPEFNGEGGLGSKIRSLFGMGSSDPPELTA